MIWQPEFTDKTLSRKTGAVQFFGSDHGGERGASLYSLIGTCKLNGVDPNTLFHIITILIYPLVLP